MENSNDALRTSTHPIAPMTALMHTAKDRGVTFFEAEVLIANVSMLALVKKLGFSVETVVDNSEIVRVVKDLRQ